VTARLTEVGDDFVEIALSEEATMIVSSRTARTYGPFFRGEDPIGWISDVFQSAEAFQLHLRSGHWNTGGRRLWLSPELEFFVADRRNF